MTNEEKILTTVEQLQKGQSTIITIVQGQQRSIDYLIQGQNRLEKKMENVEKRLSRVETRLVYIETRLDKVESDQSRMVTVIEALAAGQQDIRDTMATKKDMLDLAVKIHKYQTTTNARLENLEKHTGTHDPTKN